MVNANGDSFNYLPKNGINVMREIDETTLKSISSTTTLRGDFTWRPFAGFRLYGLASATFSNDNSTNEIGAATYSAWLDRPFEGANSASYRTYGSFGRESQSKLVGTFTGQLWNYACRETSYQCHCRNRGSL